MQRLFSSFPLLPSRKAVVPDLSTAVDTFHSSVETVNEFIKKGEIVKKELEDQEQQIMKQQKVLIKRKVELEEVTEQMRVERDMLLKIKGDIMEMKTKQEKAEIKLKKHVLDTPNSITLNVGGQAFSTSKASLLRHKRSFFEAIVENGKCTSGKEVFIDHDPKYFNVVLNYLRTKKVRTSEVKEGSWRDIRDDFQFYDISPPFEFAFAPELQEEIKKWLPNKSFELIFQASRGGEFGECCGQRGPTLNIIQSKEGYLFGGYSPEDWSAENKEESFNSSAFIFTLTNPHSIPPTKYELKESNQKAGVCTTLQNGYINFGWQEISEGEGSYDIVVEGERQVKINFPLVFEDTTKKGRLTFTGSDELVAQDLFVYSVIQQ